MLGVLKSWEVRSALQTLTLQLQMAKVDSRSCLYPYRLLFHHEHLPSEHTAENCIPVHAISISAASQHIKFPGSTSAPLKNCKSLNLLPSSFFFFFIFFTFSISGDEESEE